MKRELTKAQKILFNAISDFIGENYYAPSIEELTTITKKKSTYGVRKLLEELEKKEYISRRRGLTRTIRILA